MMRAVTFNFQPDRAAGSDSVQRNSPHGALCGVMQNNIELAGASANNQIKWSERAHAIIPVDVSGGRLALANNSCVFSIRPMNYSALSAQAIIIWRPRKAHNVPVAAASDGGDLEIVEFRADPITPQMRARARPTAAVTGLFRDLHSVQYLHLFNPLSSSYSHKICVCK
jgi:hypothetical protein